MSDLVSILKMALELKVPSILVVLGGFLIILGLSGHIKDWIEIPVARQKYTIVGGICMCLFGVCLFLLPGFLVSAEIDDKVAQFEPLGSEELTIDSESKFVNYLVERLLIRDGGDTITIRKDHTFGGNFSGTSPIGLWAWTKAGYCRELKIGTNRFEHLCGTFTVDDIGPTFIHPNGTKERWLFAK